MSVKDMLDKIEKGEANWEEIPEVVRDAVLSGRTLSDEEIATLEGGQATPPAAMPPAPAPAPADTPAQGVPPTDPKEEDKQATPPDPEPTAADLEKNPLLKALMEKLEQQSQQISELTKAVADPTRIQQVKIENELDRIMNEHGLEFDGESFTQADSKWQKVYEHFQGDPAKLTNYINSKEEQAKLGLPLPNNFEKYQEIAGIYQQYAGIKKRNPNANFGELLKIHGVETKAKAPAAAIPPAPAPSQGTNKQVDGLLPPGNGSPDLNAKADIVELFKKLEKYGDDALTPEEAEKISKALYEDAQAVR